MGMARQSRAPVILLTRPLPQSQRFAAQLHARWPDMTVVISPLMVPEYFSPDLPRRDFGAVILTSETGAEAARRISAAGVSLPRRAFCVGDRTALVAKSAGFQVQSAGGDADGLVALILSQHLPGPLLFLRGRDAAGNVEERLNISGTETLSAVVYAQSRQFLSEQAHQVLQGDAPVILPLFSSRTTLIFSAERPLNARSAPLWVAAMSLAVAEAAADLLPARMLTATRPDAPAMLDAIADLIAEGIAS